MEEDIAQVEVEKAKTLVSLLASERLVEQRIVELVTHVEIACYRDDVRTEMKGRAEKRSEKQSTAFKAAAFHHQFRHGRPEEHDHQAHAGAHAENELEALLIGAAYEGDEEACKRLIMEDGVDVDCGTPVHGFTPLYVACQEGNFNMVSPPHTPLRPPHPF